MPERTALKSGISMVAALSGRKIVAPLIFEGHCNMLINGLSNF
ncbi:hypothetical protein wVul_0661 [Wolbachia endosymbiont of Armadillidium vulgare str. wVulC]|nr:hypothetical protein wVul_0661 [Wolbachia endosymbiont of Armadillidium vulgare str. wVulC]